MPPIKVDPKGHKLKVKAEEAYAQMKWKKALELYREAAGLIQKDPKIEQRIGDLYRRVNMKQESVEQYKKVAKMFASDGFWAKAIAIQKIILEIDPTESGVQRQLAELYSKQGVQARTLPEVEPLSPTAEERSAISISGAEPLAMDHRVDDALIGGTVSISGAKPRTVDSPPEPFRNPKEVEFTAEPEENPLGSPLGKVGAIPLLSEMDTEELHAVLERLAVRRFPSGAFVCEEGDVGRSMYIIADGWVEVLTKDTDGSKLVLGKLRGGDFFGEFGLLTNGQRNASVQTKTDVELLEITSADFETIAAKHPHIWAVLEDYLRRRLIDTIVAKSPVFRAMTEEERAKLPALVRLKKFKMDDTVMAEGTDGDEMYFIKAGRLIVTVQQGKDRVLVGELGPGEYVGEVAMLTGKPRTATVRAKTDTEVFTLTRKDAAMVLRGNREVLTRLKSKMDERSKETAEAFQSYREARKTLEFV
ncbi:MAG TPA: cyclic nucleotide-binding domain-containing protein [Bdellovibrionota bacterium]|nr:cyclic nucleotide-binding domain-containing protein [Bdellovibrionota bacterium]